jgi:hypothetical protein
MASRSGAQRSGFYDRNEVTMTVAVVLVFWCSG